MNITVVGAGVAGMAAAIRLAVDGHKVTVMESNTYPGGKLTQIGNSDYRFDAGPSLFTRPDLVEDLIKHAGKNPGDYITYERMPEVCRYFYPDGTRLTAPARPEDFARELHEKLGEDPQNVLDFLKSSERTYTLTSPLFLERSLHRLRTYLRFATLKAVLNIPRLGLFGTMHAANRARFSNPKTVQLFDRYATYNGSDPYRAPAILNVIPHLEYNMGAYFPAGGMIAITNALHRLAEDVGVEFRFNTRVNEIMTDSGKITGVRTSAGVHACEAVVSNADVHTTYRRLLPQLKAPERLLHRPKSLSGIIFYWGIKKSFPELGLHNIFFAQDYRHEFNTIFNEKSISDDPTVYLHISSKQEPGDAPEGRENWFVMVNVPHDTGQDWPELIARTRTNVLAKFQKSLGTDIQSLIEYEDVLEPRLIAERTSSLGGALYGNSSNDRMAAFLRHANFSGKIKGLYFAGGSVHPGGGIPLCLLSGKIVADLVGKPRNQYR